MGRVSAVRLPRHAVRPGPGRRARRAAGLTVLLAVLLAGCANTTGAVAPPPVPRFSPAARKLVGACQLEFNPRSATGSVRILIGGLSGRPGRLAVSALGSGSAVLAAAVTAVTAGERAVLLSLTHLPAAPRVVQAQMSYAISHVTPIPARATVIQRFARCSSTRPTDVPLALPVGLHPGPSCQATYTLAGTVLRVHIRTAGPADVFVTVADATPGGGSLTPSAVPSGAPGVTLTGAVAPPVRAVEVNVTNAHGVANCAARG